MRNIQYSHVSEKSLLFISAFEYWLPQFTVYHSKVVHIFEEDFTAVVQPGVDREGLNSEVRYMRRVSNMLKGVVDKGLVEC